MRAKRVGGAATLLAGVVLAACGSQAGLGNTKDAKLALHADVTRVRLDAQQHHRGEALAALDQLRAAVVAYEAAGELTAASGKAVLAAARSVRSELQLVSETAQTTTTTTTTSSTTTTLPAAPPPPPSTKPPKHDGGGGPGDGGGGGGDGSGGGGGGGH
ncbi:MAG: hypothetical protein ACRDZP_01175 [Acidimicrobiales bacterium]